jgi:hypothetical protein
MRVCYFALVVSLTTAACGQSFLPVRPSEPLTSAAGDVTASVDGVWVTQEMRDTGMGDDQALAVQLSVTNMGREPRELSPSTFACLMELDPRRPGETRSLLSAGGATGTFPDELPEEGSLLSSIAVPPGETRTLWALFRGYVFPGGDVPRRIVVRIPITGALPIELVVADPVRGNLRWQVKPPPSAYAIGIRSTSLFGGLTAQSVSNDITRVARAGPLLWEIGLTSTLFVQSKGPLVSQTSSFLGSGLVGRLTWPVFHWGTELEPRQLGLYAGGSATLLIEIIGDRPASDMTPPQTYGMFTGEAGVELDVGAMRFAPTPFPLSPANQPLPRWMFRLAYTHASIGGVQADGYMTTLRLIW